MSKGNCVWKCCCCTCFSKDSILTVKENDKIIKKYIPEIKIDDLVLTLINGEKKFIKVNFYQAYDEEFNFYEFQCEANNKIKTIKVTDYHIMIVYDKDIKEVKYKIAKDIKVGDYFNTIDGLFQVKEIKTYNMKYKYALGVDEGSVIVNDILVSCFNFDDYNKDLSIDQLFQKYHINIL